MSNEEIISVIKIFLMSMASLSIFFALLHLKAREVYNDGYKDGQTDILSGKNPKYELTRNDKGEIVWTKINNPKTK